MSTPDWTPGRIKSFIVSALRTGARRWPPKYICLQNAFTEQKINPKSGRLAKHYHCASCHEEFTSKDVEVDHISPVVSVGDGFIDWNVFIERLFCSIENLQVLCKVCHKKKTKEERKLR